MLILLLRQQTRKMVLTILGFLSHLVCNGEDVNPWGSRDEPTSPHPSQLYVEQTNYLCLNQIRTPYVKAEPVSDQQS